MNWEKQMRSVIYIAACVLVPLLGCQSPGPVTKAEAGWGPGFIKVTFGVPEKGPSPGKPDQNPAGEKWNSVYWTLDRPGIPQNEPLQMNVEEAKHQFGATSSGQSNQVWRHVGFVDDYIAGTYKSGSNEIGIGVYFLEYFLDAGDEWYSGYYIGLTEKKRVEICPFLMSKVLNSDKLTRKLMERFPQGGCRGLHELADLL